MDARLQKLAIDSMGRMSPEQLEQIKNQLKDISPAAMERMKTKMKNMSDAELASIERRLQETDPASIPSVSSTIQARQRYAYQVAMKLKGEGNALFKKGDYLSALDHYERAKSNLSMFVDKESSDLLVLCALNKANCHLKLEMYAQCIQECTEVLKESPKNVKALFRRGQAYLHESKQSLALKDLRQALEMSDPAERDIIQRKIDEASISVDVTDAQDRDTVPSVDDRSDPVDRMADEEIQRANERLGLNVTPEMFRSARSAMKDLDEETLRKMGNLASKLYGKTSAASSDGHPTRQEMRLVSDAMESNPEWIRDRLQNMKNLSKEELDELSRISDVKVTQDMIDFAAEGMTNMTSEQISHLQRSSLERKQTCNEPTTSTKQEETKIKPKKTMSQMCKELPEETLTTWGREALDGTPPDFSNPDVLDQCFTFVNDLDEDSMVKLATSSGVASNEQEAREMVRKLKQMSPSQIEAMAQASAFAQRGLAGVAMVKKWFMSREALIVAFLMVAVGVILHVMDLL